MKNKNLFFEKEKIKNKDREAEAQRGLEKAKLKQDVLG